jgi:hypothetical protein
LTWILKMLFRRSQLVAHFYSSKRKREKSKRLQFN